MTVYADYTYYQNSFHGGAVSETAFPGLAVRASAFIDQMTFGRLRSAEEIPVEIKLAVCAVAERMNTADRSGAADINAAVKSENNDGYSVSYNDLSDIHQQLQLDYESAALLYLGGSPLLYAGVDLPKRRCCR